MASSGIEVDIKLGDFPAGFPLLWEDIHRDVYRTRQLTETNFKEECDLKSEENINHPFSINDLRKLFNDLVADLLAHHLRGECHLQIYRDNILYVHMDHRYKLRWTDKRLRIGNESVDFNKIHTYDGAQSIPETKNLVPPQLKAGQPVNPFKVDVFMLGMFILDTFLFLRKPGQTIENLNQDEAALKKVLQEIHLVLEPAVIIENGKVVRKGENLFSHLLTWNEDARPNLVEVAIRYQLNLINDLVPIHGYDAVEWIKSQDEPEPEERANPNVNYNYAILKYPDNSYYSGLVNKHEIPENKKKIVVKGDDQKDDGFEDTDEEQELQDEFPIEKIEHEEFPFRHGVGRLYDWQDAIVYDGEWVDNLPHGQGTLHFNRHISVQGRFAKGLPIGKVTVHYGNKQVPLYHGARVDGAKMVGEVDPNTLVLPHGKHLWRNLTVQNSEVTYVFLLVEQAEKEILIGDAFLNVKGLLLPEGDITVHTFRRTQDERDFLEYDDTHLFMVVAPHYFHIELSTPQEPKITLKIQNKVVFDYLAYILATKNLTWKPDELDLGNVITNGAQLVKLTDLKLNIPSIKKVNLSCINNLIKPGPNPIDKTNWIGFLTSSLLKNIEELSLAHTNIDKDSIEESAAKLEMPNLHTINLSDIRTYLSKACASLLTNSKLPKLRHLLFNNHPSLDLSELKSAATVPLETLSLNRCAAVSGETCKSIATNFKNSLRTLKIGGKAKGEEIQEMLKGLPNLESLNIGDNTEITAPVSTAAVIGAQLRSLTLEELDVNEANFAELLTANKFPKLRSLRVAGVYKLAQGEIERVLSTTFGQHFPELEHLSFYDLKISDKALRGFCGANANPVHFPKLKHLSFRMCEGISDQGVQALAEWQPLAHVSKLSLALTNVGNNGVGFLAHSANVTGLTSLNLTNCRKLTDDGVTVLVGSKNLANLTTLKLSKLKITDVSIAHLARPESPLVNLEVLDLNDTEMLTEASFYHIMSSKSLKKLRVLQLADSDIDEYALKILSESQFYQNPKNRVVVFGCNNLLPEHLHIICPAATFNYHNGLAHLTFTDQELERIVRRRTKRKQPFKFELRGTQGISELGLLWLKDYQYADLVTKIRFHDVNLEHDYLYIISLSKYLKNLRSLTIDRTARFNDKDVADFLSSANLKGLRKFKIISSHITADAFPEGLTSNLQELWLPSCIHIDKKGTPGFARVLTKLNFPELHTLVLYNCTLNDATIDALSGWSRTSHLVQLNLGRNTTVTSDAWVRFFAKADLQALKRFDFSENFISSKVLQELLKKVPKRLTHLNLSRIKQHPSAEDAAKEEYTKEISEIIQAAKGLRKLDLRGVDQMKDGVLTTIAATLSDLETLIVADCDNITAEGMREIARSPNMTNLKVLNLENTKMTDEVLTFLATSQNLKGLQRRNIKGICNTYIAHRKPNAL